MNPFLRALVAAGLLDQDTADRMSRALSPAEAQAYAEQRMAALWSGGLQGQLSRLLDVIRDNDYNLPPQVAEAFWRRENRTLFESVIPGLEDVAQEAAITAAMRGGGASMWTAVNERLISWVDDYYISADAGAFGSIPNLNDTARTIVGNAFNAWQRGELEVAANAEGLPQLIAALEPAFGPERASRIAVTETTRIYMGAEVAAGDANPYVEGYRWLTARDEKVCFPAGTMVSTPAGDVPIELIRPGQMILTRQGAKRVRATSRRLYNGRMVALDTAGGRQLSCTADHPIWSETRQAWLQADQFKAGDTVQLLNNECDRISSVIHFRLSDADDSPSQALQSLIFGSVPPRRMPVSAVNLNGDHSVGDGEINAVAPDAVLLNAGHAGGGKGLPHFGLKRRFSLRPMVAGERAELTIGSGWQYSHSLAAGLAVHVMRGAAALLRAVMPVQVLFGNEHFAATFAGRVLGFCQPAGAGANGVAVGNAGPNSKILPASRANLYNHFGSRVGFITLAPAVVPLLVQLRAGELLTAADTESGHRGAGSIIARLGAILSGRVAGMLELFAALRTGVHRHVLPPASAKHPLTALYHGRTGIAIDVYDIQVEGVPEFYAGGVLVHNCPICGPLDGQWAAKGSGGFGSVGFNPAHVGCRCNITPESSLTANVPLGQGGAGGWDYTRPNMRQRAGVRRAD